MEEEEGGGCGQCGPWAGGGLWDTHLVRGEPPGQSAVPAGRRRLSRAGRAWAGPLPGAGPGAVAPGRAGIRRWRRDLRPRVAERPWRRRAGGGGGSAGRSWHLVPAGSAGGGRAAGPPSRGRGAPVLPAARAPSVRPSHFAPVLARPRRARPRRARGRLAAMAPAECHSPGSGAPGVPGAAPGRARAGPGGSAVAGSPLSCPCILPSVPAERSFVPVLRTGLRRDAVPVPGLCQAGARVWTGGFPWTRPLLRGHWSLGEVWGHGPVLEPCC